jgi:hypothetical protein
MHNAIIDKNEQLTITPSSTSNKNDFDFLIGEFIVQHKRLKNRLTGSNEWHESVGAHKMELILGGIGNLEQHEIEDFDGTFFKGAAFRTFNIASRLWSIYWADSRFGNVEVPLVGSFENKIGYFYASDTLNGNPVLVQFIWDSTVADEPVWEQAFSSDGGNTWETNWYMNFKKKKL